MTTARDIVKQALRKIHVLGTGQSLSNEDAQRGLDTLNQMIAVESTDSYVVYNETIETFDLTDSKIEYTIGTSGQDFDTTRPLNITAAYVTEGKTDYPLTKYDQRQYSKIPDKTLGGTPSVYYYDANYPTPTLYLYAAPTTGDTITIYSQKELAQFTDLDTDFTFPPEYQAFLIYNLAVWIAGEYERQPSVQVQQVANKTKDAIQTQNVKNNNFTSKVDTPSAENQRTDYNVFRGY